MTDLNSSCERKSFMYILNSKLADNLKKWLFLLVIVSKIC